MASILPKPDPSTPLNSLDGVRPKAAKAGLERQSVSIALSSVVKDALIRHYGSLKSAAITLQMDQGQLTRELQTGDFKLKKLDRDDEAKAFIARALHEAFGDADPKAQARRAIREVRARLDELQELVS